MQKGDIQRDRDSIVAAVNRTPSSALIDPRNTVNYNFIKSLTIAPGGPIAWPMVCIFFCTQNVVR